jgi:drug/metabolite transporter (DMT)-like permease
MSRNAFLFAAMCLVWGLTFLPVRIAADHVPPVLFAAARFVLASALILAWAGRDAGRVPRAAWPRLVGTALLVNSFNYSLLFWGAAHAPSGLAAIVNMATIPVWSLLAARLLEGEAITARRAAALGLGAAGLVLLFWTRARSGLSAGGDALEGLGLAAVALGTCGYCFGAVLTRPLTATVPVLALAGWQSAIGAVGLIAITLALEPVGVAQLSALLAWPTLGALIFIVLAGSLVGFTIYLRLLRDWGAFRAGLYAFVSPVIAVAAGFVVLGEAFGASEAAGALLMFGAAALALRR